MTEKIKERITGWLVGVILTLLGFIASGVSYLIVKGWEVDQELQKTDQEMQKKCAMHDDEIRYLAGLLWSDPDTPENDKIILQDMSELETRGK